MARGKLVLLLTVGTLWLSVSAKKVTTAISSSETETLTVKTKSGRVGAPMNFKATESRVTDLISKLDSVSGHAARAENELQATLRELWQIVDLLGKDRCGDVVERVRVLQRNMETRIVEQDAEIRSNRGVVTGLESKLRARTSDVESLQAELGALRESRGTLEAELAEMRGKLSRVNSKIARESSYKVVVTRLEKILSVAVTRIDLLEKIIAMLNDDARATAEWKKELSTVSVSVRTLEQDFLAEGSGAEVRARTRIAQLEQELRLAASERDDATRERKSMSAHMARLQRRAEAGASGGAGSAREKIVISEGESGWGGMMILCFISVCTGGIIVFVLTFWQHGPAEAAQPPPRGSPTGSPSAKFAFSPSGNRSPGFHHSKSSPMQYVHDSGNKGATPRIGTPRLY